MNRICHGFLSYHTTNQAFMGVVVIYQCGTVLNIQVIRNMLLNLTICRSWVWHYTALLNIQVTYQCGIMFLYIQIILCIIMGKHSSIIRSYWPRGSPGVSIFSIACKLRFMGLWMKRAISFQPPVHSKHTSAVPGKVYTTDRINQAPLLCFYHHRLCSQQAHFCHMPMQQIPQALFSVILPFLSRLQLEYASSLATNNTERLKTI